ncbi:VUT family protein [Streptomyces sp. CB03911]|uniref:VUT family protein n=1 Tax=Streptomyces sp. CB03911 TaxID=1804758 RepID=UPI00093DD80B|nr:VUT family protein [Streptomyces sp. CB03911]OKI19295.1 hypothetical protein A6A07_07275 [Streptomyces sp. CB03911]
MRKRAALTGALALGAYAGSIYAANVVTARYGMLSIGLGMHATAGTLFAGAALMLRNILQDIWGRAFVLLAIAAGAALSFTMSPALAMASAVAFVVAELADMSVYTPLRKRGWARAVLPASLVGALADTVVFLTLAGFPVAANLPGQMVGKYVATAVPVAVVLTIRAVRRRQ